MNAVRSDLFQQLKDREGRLVSGIAIHYEPGGLKVDLMGIAAVLPDSEAIPGEHFQPGERIDAYLMEASQAPVGVVARLSRVAPMFLARLVESAVSVVRTGDVAVQAVAREPGSRAKLAVRALVPGMDAVTAVMVDDGAALRGVTDELRGEVIDLVRFSDDIEAFAREALLPIRIRSVSIDHDAHTLHVQPEELQPPMTAPERRQHVRLARSLVGWDVALLF